MPPREVVALRIVRRAIATQWTNYVGQEGRGAAESFKREALRAIDAQIAAYLVADARARGIKG